MNTVERALRYLLADLDYDIHKSIERDEETGDNNYPHLAEWFTEQLKPYRNQILEEAAQVVGSMASECRSGDGNYPDEWRTRDVRDALYGAAERILEERS